MLDRPPAGSRRPLALIGVVVVLVIAAITSQQHSKPPPGASLPSTPSALGGSSGQPPRSIIPRGVPAPVRAGALRRLQGRHRPLLRDLLQLSAQQLVPYPPGACRTVPPPRSRRSNSATAAGGATSRSSSATSTAGGRRSTSFPAGRCAHDETASTSTRLTIRRRIRAPGPPELDRRGRTRRRGLAVVRECGARRRASGIPVAVVHTTVRPGSGARAAGDRDLRLHAKAPGAG